MWLWFFDKSMVARRLCLQLSGRHNGHRALPGSCVLTSCVAECRTSCFHSLCHIQVYLFSRYMELLQPDLQRLSLGSILSDIRTSMIDECDFTKE